MDWHTHLSTCDRYMRNTPAQPQDGPSTNSSMSLLIFQICFQLLLSYTFQNPQNQREAQQSTHVLVMRWFLIVKMPATPFPQLPHTTNHDCLKEQLRMKSCPWTCPPVVETRFLPKPLNVEAVTITGNSHTCYQFRWEALAKLHRTFGLCDHTPLSCQIFSDFTALYTNRYRYMYVRIHRLWCGTKILPPLFCKLALDAYNLYKLCWKKTFYF